MTLQVLVPVADGSEDIETVTLVDVFRRARFEVTLASVHDRPEIRAARQTRIVADALIADCAGRRFDLIACPGGMPGATHLAESGVLADLLLAQHREGRPVAAICAAPAVVLAPLGILDQVPATAHPGFHRDIPRLEAEERIVRSGHIVTSQGPGTALEFALALVEMLGGKQLRDDVAAPMVIGDY